MIEGHDFCDAYFTNNERTIVESLWWSKEDEVYRTHLIKAEEDNEQWKMLLQKISIDDLHERTYKRIAEASDVFKETIKDIAMNDDSIVIGGSEDGLQLALIDFIFNEELDKEQLFAFKLKLFEVDKIKESHNRELKAKLRKAKNIVECIQVAIEFKQ